MGAGAWAFIGGLTANLLTTDALGTIPLGLLLVVGMVTVLDRALGRRTALLALLGGAAGSVLLDVVGVGVLGGTGAALRPLDLVPLLVPSALVNGVLAVVLFLVARAAMNRLGREPVMA